MADTTEAKRPPKSKEELQAELAAARLRLSSNVESLINQVHPKSVANKAYNDARDLVDAEVQNVKQKVSGVIDSAKSFASPRADDAKGFFKDGYGWRTDRFMAVSGVIAGLLTVGGFVLAVVAGIRKALKADKKSHKTLGKKR